MFDVPLCLIEAAGEKDLPLSYLFADHDGDASSDATALIYKLHTSDTIKYSTPIALVISRFCVLLAEKAVKDVLVCTLSVAQRIECISDIITKRYLNSLTHSLTHWQYFAAYSSNFRVLAWWYG